MERLLDELTRLPGIGRRTAERLAFFVLKSPPDEALGLARAIEDVKNTVRQCSVCFNLSDGEMCAVCSDERRNREQVLVVEQPRDLIALELTGAYKGLYHVLMGRIDPLEGVGPGDLTVAGLLDRVRDAGRQPGGVRVREVVLGLNPTLEGDGTALFLADQLSTMGVEVTRLARGLPTGGQLEWASKAVLADAIAERRKL
ncbi:MAG: recombination mediator RecR [Planctomycetota bacterium]